MLTLWRKLLYQEINQLKFDGEVLDLGGTKGASYHQLIKGKLKIITANIAGNKDLLFDFENNFPIEDQRYDAVICLNVLEHIFNYQNVLSECFRILKPGGELVMAVPFIVAIHPDPNDYWRFSGTCLKKLLEDRNFKDIQIKEIGCGIFSSVCNLTYNVLKVDILRKAFMAVGVFLDHILDWILLFLGIQNRFTKKNYPLGYFVYAKK